MSGGDQQVVALYELNAMSPEMIAEVLGYDVLAVKSALASHSRIYRESFKQEVLLARGASSLDIQQATNDSQEGEIVNNEQFQQLKQAAINIALSSDDNVGAATRARMIKFLLNEKKGRNDVRGQVKNIHTNVILINQGLQQAKEAIRRSLGVSKQQEVIEA